MGSQFYRIKPLEWVEAGCRAYCATALGGLYAWVGNGRACWALNNGEPHYFGYCIDDAKADAGWWYEGMILRALEPVDPQQEGTSNG